MAATSTNQLPYKPKSSAELRKQNSGSVVWISLLIIIVSVVVILIVWEIFWYVLSKYGINPPESVKFWIMMRN